MRSTDALLLPTFPLLLPLLQRFSGEDVTSPELAPHHNDRSMLNGFGKLLYFQASQHHVITTR